MLRRTLPLALGAATLIGAAGAARAQAPLALQPAAAPANPTFTFGNPKDLEEVEELDWTATAEAGAILTTGNSRTTTATGTAKIVRLDPKNKLEGVFALAYARSAVFVAVDRDGSGTIGPAEIEAQSSTTANSWQGKLRYDRFVTKDNSLYGTAALGADRPAGKQLVGGAQVGYSRRLYKARGHEAVAELGYDLSYEHRVVGEGVAIHSARAFAGYTYVVKKDVTAVETSVEALFNLNRLATLPEEASPFEDARVHAVASLTTKLTDDVAFSFGFQARFDNVPAPRPALAIPYDAEFVPVADKLDTITKATIIVSLF